jgi:hypothetical protein
MTVGELVVGLLICLGFGMLTGLFRRAGHMGRG